MERRNQIEGVFLGILLVFGLHIAAISLLSIISNVLIKNFNNIPAGTIVRISSRGYLFIGIFQLIYIIPTIILLKRQQRWGFMKGVIIGAVITVLLNGACLALVGGIR